jgi:hypothetical protein
MLRGSLAKHGFERWFHSFNGVDSLSGEQRTFFIEYQLINPSLGAEQPIIAQHPYFKKRGMKPSYMLVKAGVLPGASGKDGTQLNAFYSINDIKTAANPFVIQTPDSFYSENLLSGYIDISISEAANPFLMTDAGSIEWELEVHKAVSCDMGFISSPTATALGMLSSFWHAEGMRTFYKGSIILNGTEYTVTPDASFGYADKNWGRAFNTPLLLLSSSHLTSDRSDRTFRHSALAINGCFPRFLFIPLKRRLMIQLTYMGEDFEYNFAKIRCMSKCKWKTKETNKRYIWHIKAQNKDSVVKISLNCTKRQMMELLYETPDGELPDEPLLCGAGGNGTVEIYRREGKDLELLDTLRAEDVLCMYQE